MGAANPTRKCGEPQMLGDQSLRESSVRDRMPSFA